MQAGSHRSIGSLQYDGAPFDNVITSSLRNQHVASACTLVPIVVLNPHNLMVQPFTNFITSSLRHHYVNITSAGHPAMDSMDRLVSGDPKP